MEAPSFDWAGYVKLAKELATRPEDACQRTAIGRAYYCVFHLARKRIEANGYTRSPGGGSHKQVWDKYQSSENLDCKKLGEIAKRLKEKRERADYEDIFVRLSDEMPAILAYAGEFAILLDSLPAELPLNIVAKR